MTRKKLSLDMLSKELTQIPVERQVKVKGGAGSGIVLSPVSVVASGDPDPIDSDPFDDDPTGTSGANGGDGSTNDPSGPSDYEHINDPNNVLTNYQNNLMSIKGALQQYLTSGNLPAGVTEDGLKAYLNAVNHVMDILATMQNSDKDFRVEQGNVAGAATGETYYDSTTGEYVIKLENLNDQSTLVHELEHIYQIETGDIVYDENGSPSGVSLEDEVAAYQLQHEMDYGALAGSYDLSGNPVSSGDYRVTAADVLAAYPGVYDNLPATDADAAAIGNSASGG